MSTFNEQWLASYQSRKATAATPGPASPRRQRKPRAQRAEPNEVQIHIAVVGHLRHRAMPGLWWFHPANGVHRDERTAAKLKAMGVRAGVPDIVMLHAGKLFALELKRHDGRLSPEQHAARAEIEAAGGFWACAYSIRAALEILTAWGLIHPAGQPARATAPANKGRHAA